jgi:rod shape determining protein RodA
LYAAAVSPVLIWQKIPKKYWQLFVGVFLALGIIGWTLVLQPYQKARITSFFSGAQADQSGAGYNARQALIAVGSGELWGRGLGHGSQSQLRFLPERQTDFIFASLAEEWGLLGSLLVIGLYGALIAFLLQEAKRATNSRHALFLTAAAVAFFAQVFVNIGMNIGLLPITGVTLPLVSYGGSSLLATMLLLGVAQQLILQAGSSRHLRIS